MRSTPVGPVVDFVRGAKVSDFRIHLNKKWEQFNCSHIILRFCVLLALFLYRLGCLKDDLVIRLIHIHLHGRTVLELAAEQFHG